MVTVQLQKTAEGPSVARPASYIGMSSEHEIVLIEKI